MPTSSTTVEVSEPTGSQWPGMASSQVAVSAEVRGEQHRDARGDQRAEHADEQDQGERQ
jgi:hypothetical protein